MMTGGATDDDLLFSPQKKQPETKTGKKEKDKNRKRETD
jgi:hypothetical protein